MDDIWKEAEEWANKTLKTQPKNVNVQQTMEEACLHLANLLDWNRKRLEMPVVELRKNGSGTLLIFDIRQAKEGTYRKEQS